MKRYRALTRRFVLAVVLTTPLFVLAMSDMIPGDPIGHALSAGEHALYFEAAAVIVTLILLGQVLELRARAHTGAAIKKLLGLAPKTARRVREDGSDEDVPLDERPRNPKGTRCEKVYRSTYHAIQVAHMQRERRGDPFVDARREFPACSGTIAASARFQSAPLRERLPIHPLIAIGRRMNSNMEARTAARSH